MVAGPGRRDGHVALAPLDLVHATRADARPRRRSLGRRSRSGPSSGSSSRWACGLSACRRPCARSRERPLARGAALAAIALAAWPLGLLLRVSADALPGDPVINDATYFVEQGGVLLWIFAALGDSRGSPARGRSALVAPLAAALLPARHAAVRGRRRRASPPTWSTRRSSPPWALVRRRSRPGDVVLQRPGARYPPLPVILVGRRVPYERFTPYLTQFVVARGALRRHEAVYASSAPTTSTTRAAIARELGARFLCLYEADRVRFDLSALADPVFEEPDARCYRLRTP